MDFFSFCSIFADFSFLDIVVAQSVGGVNFILCSRSLDMYLGPFKLNISGYKALFSVFMGAFNLKLTSRVSVQLKHSPLTELFLLFRLIFSLECCIPQRQSNLSADFVHWFSTDPKMLHSMGFSHHLSSIKMAKHCLYLESEFSESSPTYAKYILNLQLLTCLCPVCLPHGCLFSCDSQALVLLSCWLASLHKYFCVLPMVPAPSISNVWKALVEKSFGILSNGHSPAIGYRWNF